MFRVDLSSSVTRVLLFPPEAQFHSVLFKFTIKVPPANDVQFDQTLSYPRSNDGVLLFSCSNTHRCILTLQRLRQVSVHATSHHLTS